MLVPLGNKTLLRLRHREVEEMDWGIRPRLARNVRHVHPGAAFFLTRAFDRNTTLWGSYLIRSAALISSAETPDIPLTLGNRDRFGPSISHFCRLGLRAAMVMKAIHMIQRRPFRSCDCVRSRSAFISERFNSRRKRSMLRREIWWPLSPRPSGSKIIRDSVRGVTTIYSMGR